MVVTSHNLKILTLVLCVVSIGVDARQVLSNLSKESFHL